MTNQEITKAAGYEIYADLASNFRKSCDIEGEPVKLDRGSLYLKLYSDGAE